MIRLKHLLGIALLLMLAAPLASAQSPFAQSPPAEDRQATATSTASENPGLRERAVTWMLVTQRSLHQQLNAGIRQLRQDTSLANIGWLFLISFGYGVFHAAGPGHGKAVISAYLLTHPARLGTGLLLSFLASMLQGLTAIVLVVGLVKIAGWLSRDAMQQVGLVEQVSFAILAVFGAMLLLRAARRLWRRAMTAPTAATPPPVSAGDLAPAQRGSLSFQPISTDRSTITPDSHQHDAGCGCGHPHHVAPQALDQHGSRWAMVGAILAVGSRPCTGAVLILAAANLLGLLAVGIGAVMAMALGTAITVSTLAALAVFSRDQARRLARGMDTVRLAVAGDLVAIVGGVLILFAGVSLLVAALGNPTPALYRL